MALALHGSQIWGWSVHSQESADLQTSRSESRVEYYLDTSNILLHLIIPKLNDLTSTPNILLNYQDLYKIHERCGLYSSLH